MSDMTGKTITWQSAGRKAQSPPDPRYPVGVDVDLSAGKTACQVSLPYPAKECGSWLVECSACRMRVLVTAAGRPDDPRSVKIGCRFIEG